jgi:hypothetical protein
MGYVIQGREVTMPVEVRDASVAAATFLVPAGPVRRLVSPTGLEVATVPGGRAVCSLAVIDYKDNDLGDYNEVAVVFMVRPHDDAGGKGMAPYIHRLPVDQEFTCEAGRGIWGFPKWVASIDVRDEGRARSMVLTDEGRHVLTLSIRGGGLPLPSRELPLQAYSFRDGVLRRTPWMTRNSGVRGRVGGVTVVLGDGHPMADELRSVGLPRRAVMSSTVGRMQATFGEAEVC